CFNRSGYFASMIDKHRALDRAKSPKIVFVGGSNLAFGLDSARVRREFNEDVVNMGVSVKLGLQYQLEEIKDAVRCGDTIVICPEYDLLSEDPYTNNYLVAAPQVLPRSLVWVAREYLTTPGGWAELGANLGQLLPSKWSSWRGVLLAQLGDRKPKPSFKDLINPGEIEAISRSHFTREGDLIGHLSLPSYAANWLGPIRKLNPATATALNRFAAFAQSRGATVVLIPPPIARTAYDFNRKTIDASYSTLRDQLHFPVLSEPQHYVFDNSLFFNTMWHLQGPGREERTTLILRDLESDRRVALIRSAAAL
ncbi:MAG: hypothetical protein ACRD3W_16095, partial [Terriglobales bacterium]